VTRDTTAALWDALFAAMVALQDIELLIDQHPKTAKRDARTAANRAERTIRATEKEAA